MVSFSTALLVAAASALLANAQSSSVNCVYASWSNNGDGQNPCQIWAELGSRCGTFSVEPLTPVGADGLSSSYPVPSAGQTTPNDACQCNHIAYSLMAACSWCQEGVYSDSWSTESDWSNGCTSYATSGVDSSVNATGINIPPYALQPNPGPVWDPTDAQAAQVRLGSSGTTEGPTSDDTGSADTVFKAASALGWIPIALSLAF